MNKRNVALLVSGAVIIVVLGATCSGVASWASCDWQTESKVTATRVDGDQAITSLALAVKGGDDDDNLRMRTLLTAAFETRSVVVGPDDASARPRAQITIEEMSGIWTPSYAPLTSRVSAGVDLPRPDPNPHAIQVVVNDTGTCMGLVSRAHMRHQRFTAIANEIAKKVIER